MSVESYKDEAMLKCYMDSQYDPDEPAVHTRYFTLYSLLPDLRVKTLLDLPCGLGHKARKFISQCGAKKVFAVDIIQKQLEMSKEADFAAGIKPGQIEYVVHDARQPAVIVDPQADLCISVHLFCYAQDYPALVEMCRCIYLNLKPGGACYSIVCSLSRDDQLAKQFERFCEKILHIDPWQGDVCKPRRFHHVYRKGFDFDVLVWDYDAICKALREVGFSSVELHPYQEDPSHSDRLNLTQFTSAVQGNVIVATK